MFWAHSCSYTRTSSNSKYKSLNSLGHSGCGHCGGFGFGTFSFGLSLLGVVGTSHNIVKFADTNLTHGHP